MMFHHMPLQVSFAIIKLSFNCCSEGAKNEKAFSRAMSTAFIIDATIAKKITAHVTCYFLACRNKSILTMRFMNDLTMRLTH